MSHFKERTEKNCLNCNTTVHGRYCHVCGQENKETRDSFWHLLTHFVSDIFHFDGKFFSTARSLLVKPGFLSQEYMRGRRASYLDPIRMYIFISAVFFLLYFNFLKGHGEHAEGTHQEVSAAEMVHKLELKKAKFETALSNKELPDVARRQLAAQLEETKEDLQLLAKDSTAKQELAARDEDIMFRIDGKRQEYHSEKEYDEVQLKLPAAKRDGWLERVLIKKKIRGKEKYGTEYELGEQFSEKFQHSIPQLLFVSLPFFALILQLLYVRKKQFYYVDHIIYTLHLYAALFIVIFLQISLAKLAEVSWLSWIEYLNVILSLYIFYYWYKSMRVFYAQDRGITILKFILELLLASSLLLLLFILFVILSFIRI